MDTFTHFFVQPRHVTNVRLLNHATSQWYLFSLIVLPRVYVRYYISSAFLESTTCDRIVHLFPIRIILRIANVHAHCGTHGDLLKILKWARNSFSILMNSHIIL